jgi:large subunit ribosomal protein L29
MSKTSSQLEKFRDLPDDELVAQLATTRDELFRLHLGQHTNQVTSTALLRTKRRDIARIITVLNARKAGTETQAQGTKTKEAETVVETPAKKKSTKKAKAQ